MLFKRSDLSARYRREVGKRNSAYKSFAAVCESFAFDSAGVYDIFLSNRFVEKEVVVGLAIILRDDFKLRVYVDLENGYPRDDINLRTANVIREKMALCKCLWYVDSLNAGSSKWMSWEAGYMDGRTGRVAICPIADVNVKDVFKGREYLSLYPFVSWGKSTAGENMLWINETDAKYVSFNAWLGGGMPHLHN